MFTINTLIQVITIVLALAGAYFIAYTAVSIRGRIDNNLLRAKVFLNESFLKDNWFFLFLASLFFLMNAALKFNDILGLSLGEGSSDTIEQVIVLGALTCCVLSEYKWFRLIGTPKSVGKEISLLYKK